VVDSVGIRGRILMEPADFRASGAMTAQALSFRGGTYLPAIKHFQAKSIDRLATDFSQVIKRISMARLDGQGQLTAYVVKGGIGTFQTMEEAELAYLKVQS